MPFFHLKRHRAASRGSQKILSIYSGLFKKCDARFKITHSAHQCGLVRFSARQSLIYTYPKIMALWLEDEALESRLLVCPPLSLLSDVKNNSSTRARTSSHRFDHQMSQYFHSDTEAVRAPSGRIINLSRSLLWRPTHLLKIRQYDKWPWCQTFVTACPDILKKKKKKTAATTSTWWIGVFILRPEPLKTKASRMFMESEPRCCFSWGALNFSAEVDAESARREWTEILKEQENRFSLINVFKE